MCLKSRVRTPRGPVTLMTREAISTVTVVEMVKKVGEVDCLEILQHDKNCAELNPLTSGRNLNRAGCKNGLHCWIVIGVAGRREGFTTRLLLWGSQKLGDDGVGYLRRN